MTVSRTWALAAAGLVTGAAGLAVSHVVTALLGLRVNPVVAVAEAVIALTPGRVAEFLIGLVGVYDKPILVAGVVTVVLGVSAWAGSLARKGLAPAFSVFVVLAALASVALLTRPGAGPADVIPVIAGTVTWFVALPLLVDSAGAAAQPARREAADPARRFLLLAGGVAVASVALGVVGQLVGAARRGVETARELLRLPVTRGTAPPGADLELAGLEPWRTPNDRFYRIDTALAVPTVTPTDWRLRIHGMVDREVVLTYDDLLSRRLTEAWVTLCCVSNEVGGELIGNAWWSGVRVADLLAEAGVRPGADAVLQTSEDDWTCGTPLAALTDDRDALLAVAMNGEPLPLEHGFPVRVVVPGLYGFVSATKWVVDLEVTRFADITAYWTSRGWAERAPVKTQSRIDVPRPGATVPAGPLRVGGSAWAQHRGVETVEVRLDGRPWAPALLGRVPNADTWVQWSAMLDVSPGPHTLAVRATDATGETQTPERADVVPDGATGWHTVDFSAE